MGRIGSEGNFGLGGRGGEEFEVVLRELSIKIISIKQNQKGNLKNLLS
jgi:hypothetical protein